MGTLLSPASGRRGARAGSRRSGMTDLLVRDAVRRTKAGDRGGLEYLYVRYAADVRRHVASVVRDPYEAEDVTQNVFTRLPESIQRYEERSASFSAWLLRVARNAALDERRKRRPVPASDVQDDARGGAVEAAPESESADVVMEALDGLPAEQRAVLLLRHFVGLSPGEIADRLGRSEDAVHCLHHRGRGSARKALARLGATPATVEHRPR